MDARFGLSRTEAADAVSKAVSLWEKSTRLDLFREEAKGAVEIRFVYDYRQEAADKLKGIGGSIDNSKSSYESLKLRYENLKAEHEQKEAAFRSDIDAYHERMNTLKAESEAAAQQGGMPEEVYKRFMEEKESLDSQRQDLEARQGELCNSLATLNSIVVLINDIANNLNLEVVNYNQTGEKLREEFSEGLYEMKNGRQTITIYHFTDRKSLERILAHEFGHALGLGHNNNPQALMYRLNLSDSIQLAPDDVQALRDRCNGK